MSRWCSIHTTPRLARSREVGSAMLLVMAVTAAVSILLMSLLYQLSAEQSAGQTGLRSQQAWHAALSGVHFAAAVVAEAPFEPELWRESEALFRHRLVADDGVDRWYFTVFVAEEDPAEPWRYGVGDEAARLHLEQASDMALAGLPNMTPELVDAVRFYLETGLISGDGQAEENDGAGGLAEQVDAELAVAFAGGAVTPATVDELLLVQELHAGLLYGESGYVARRLRGRGSDEATLDADPEAALGLRHWLTVWSHDPDRDGEGQPRTPITASPETLSSAGLPPDAVAFVEARRELNMPVSHPAELLAVALEVPGSGDEEARTVESGIDGEQLHDLLDRFGADPQRSRRGLVNVLTAPARVLAGVPGIDLELAEQIVLSREDLAPELRRTPAWLHTEGVVDAAGFRELAPWVTSRCSQIRLQVVGYAQPSEGPAGGVAGPGVYRVLEAVVDLADERPRIMYLRDLTQLGLPFALEADDLPGSGL